jgi:hypothetical protein
MSSTAHMTSKKKSRTNEGDNKRMTKAIDFGRGNSSDTALNLGSKSIHESISKTYQSMMWLSEQNPVLNHGAHTLQTHTHSMSSL